MCDKFWESAQLFLRSLVLIYAHGGQSTLIIELHTNSKLAMDQTQYSTEFPPLIY